MTHVVQTVFRPDKAGTDAQRSRPPGGAPRVSPEGSRALETPGRAGGGQFPPQSARPPRCVTASRPCGTGRLPRGRASSGRFKGSSLGRALAEHRGGGRTVLTASGNSGQVTSAGRRPQLRTRGGQTGLRDQGPTWGDLDAAVQAAGTARAEAPGREPAGRQSGDGRRRQSGRSPRPGDRKNVDFYPKGTEAVSGKDNLRCRRGREHP